MFFIRYVQHGNKLQSSSALFALPLIYDVIHRHSYAICSVGNVSRYYIKSCIIFSFYIGLFNTVTRSVSNESYKSY
jgi:hypothetical protein